MNNFLAIFDRSILRSLVIALLIHIVFLNFVIFSFPSYKWHPSPILVFLGAIFPKQDFVDLPSAFPRGTTNPIAFTPHFTAVQLPVAVIEKPLFNNRLDITKKKEVKVILPVEKDKRSTSTENDEQNKSNQIDHVPQYIPLKLELR